MPERRSRPPGAGDWHDAFAALPLESPPRGGWSALAARLDARRRPRWPLWGALAATLALALILPWRLQTPAAPDTAPVDATMTPVRQAATDPLDPLYAESARLEALLGLMRDEQVASGPAAALAGELETRLAGIDARLRDPALTAQEQRALWQARVDALRALTGFESTRRWLAATGDRYDPALVRID